MNHIKYHDSMGIVYILVMLEIKIKKLNWRSFKVTNTWYIVNIIQGSKL